MRQTSGIISNLIDLDRVDTWAPELLRVLNDHRDTFFGWEEEFARPLRDPFARDDDDRERAIVSGKEWDRAIRTLSDVLLQFSVRGWHCTRITDEEARAIVGEGMGLPNQEVLKRRIECLVAARAVEPAIGKLLIKRNQAADSNRAGMLWFCFFPPRVAGEHGIERFFRRWGGEALYNSHEDDPVTSPVLESIGTPMLVEADIPIALLPSPTGFAFKIARRFAISLGCKTNEPVTHEDRIVRLLPPACVRRLVRFPEPDFMELTGCNDWHKKLP